MFRETYRMMTIRSRCQRSKGLQSTNLQGL